MNSTHQMAELFAAIEREISQEKGPFTLFGLFQREDSVNYWDLVVSAQWIGTDERPALDYIVAKLNKYLSEADLLKLSRIVILDPSEPFVQTITSIVQVEHGRIEFKNNIFNGIPMQEAIIFTAKATTPSEVAA